MDKIVKFIDLDVPITKCNLRCHYCYVITNEVRDTEETVFKYSASHIGKALTQERLGGVCHFNMCGHGETLIPKEIPEITKEILMNGHYVMIVTNGLLTNRLEEMIQFPAELRKRLGFKFSFHYLELLRLNLLGKFFENIRKVRAAGMSISIEMTPSDELIPYIEDIKNLMMKEFGVLCHLTVPRDGNKGAIELLSKYTLEEYAEIWKDFDSELFRFKMSTWGIRRCEFCYAGAWSGLLNLGDGEMYSCYGSKKHVNVFKNIKRPIKFRAVGKHCSQPHCYNSHSFLSFGLIPDMGELPCYAQMRDRVDNEGHWLTPEMSDTMSQKLYNNNELFTGKQIKQTEKEYKIAEMKAFFKKFPDKIKYELKKRRKK